MTTHREKRRLAYSAEQMFDLVADIEQYPAFLPWCSQLRILDRRVQDGVDVLTAEMTVSFKVHRERFKTEAWLDRENMVIRIKYIDGPFKYLDNEWRFEPISDTRSVVEFFIDFEFKNRTLQMLIGFVFNEAVRRMIGAFETRARVLYRRSDILS